MLIEMIRFHGFGFAVKTFLFQFLSMCEQVVQGSIAKKPMLLPLAEVISFCKRFRYHRGSTSFPFTFCRNNLEKTYSIKAFVIPLCFRMSRRNETSAALSSAYL